VRSSVHSFYLTVNSCSVDPWLSNPDRGMEHLPPGAGTATSGQALQG
jgi:hypothetical protein